jgi:hypothetical protein
VGRGVGTGNEFQSVHVSSLLGSVGLVTAEVGWKIYSSYLLEESRCVEIVGRLIWDFCVYL